MWSNNNQLRKKKVQKCFFNYPSISSLYKNLGMYVCISLYHWPHLAAVIVPIGTFRSDYDYEYEFFNMYPLRMPDCVRLSRQLVLSSKSRRRLDTNYEIFNKSRPPTTSSLQVHRRVKKLVARIHCEMFLHLVSQCFGDFVASCVVCLLNNLATDKML